MKPSPFAISRRRFLASTAALATTLQLQRAARAAGLMADAQVCTLAAEQEVGPYYVANELIRSDISEQKPGIPLSLRILVLDARTCKPISNAAVDVWHCDALGLYAGFTQQNPMGPGGPGGPDGPARFGGPPPGGSPPGFDPQHPGNRPGPPENMGPPPRNHPSDNFTFLRGIQLTGADGAVSFRTVFPGFYMGRTNHIHFKVRIGGHATAKSYGAGHTSHTGQVFFPEDIAAGLMEHEPYSLHKIHRTTQGEDEVFTDQHGDLFVARLEAMQPGHNAAGMHADLVASVDPTAIPADAGRRGGPGGPSGPPAGKQQD
jgi:protocatechuate 3,4-dioxygenase beta subunit